MNTWISNLVGTLSSYFRIGRYIRLKGTSSLQVRDGGDTAYIPVDAASVAFNGATSGRTVVAPPDVAGDYTLFLPPDVGTNGQFWKTFGDGTTDWGDVPALSVYQVPVVYNSSSPISIFVPSANAVNIKTIIKVTTAFDAADAYISVGVAGDVARYMNDPDSILSEVALYTVEPMYTEDGTPDEVIVTFTPGDGGTTGAATVYVFYTNPLTP